MCSSFYFGNKSVRKTIGELYVYKLQERCENMSISESHIDQQSGLKMLRSVRFLYSIQRKDILSFLSPVNLNPRGGHQKVLTIMCLQKNYKPLRYGYSKTSNVWSEW